MNVKSRIALAGLAVLAAALAGGAVLTSGPDGVGRGAVRTGSAASAQAGDGRLVLVSGRDDHGLLASEQVELRGRPDAGAPPTAQVADATLVRVVAAQGTWLRVSTVEGAPAEGWVDDFFLRGTLHLVGSAPTCQVDLDGRSLPMGEQAVALAVRGDRAQVRLERTGEVGWVARSALREWVPEQGCGPSGAPEEPEEHDHHG